VWLKKKDIVEAPPQPVEVPIKQAFIEEKRK
jgi:hypothetical protein